MQKIVQKWFVGLLACWLIGIGAGAQGQTWVNVTDDQFVRANTSVGAAGTTTGAGNGWIDRLGGVANITSNALVLTQNTVGLNSNRIDATHVLLRPTSENATDERVDFITAGLPDTSATSGWTAVLRVQSNSVGTFSLNSQYVFQLLHSGACMISRTTNYFTSNQISTGGASFTPTVGHVYEVIATTNNVWPTTLTLMVYDNTSDAGHATPKVNLSVVDSTTELQVAGQSGVGLSIGTGTVGATFSNTFARVTTLTTTQTGALTVPSLPAGGGPLSAPPSTGIGFQAVSPNPTGGTPPYTIQWYRGTGNFTPGAGTILTGKTGNAIFDPNIPTGVSNFSISYKAVYTDAVAATVTSAAINENSIVHIPTGGVFAVGDSIMYGYGSSSQIPSTSAFNYAMVALKADTSIASGASSPYTFIAYTTSVLDAGSPGRTSSDWVTPAYLSGAIALAVDCKVKVILLMLGTNDSKDDVATTTAQYKANIQYIIAAFKAVLPSIRFCIQKPPWLNPLTYASNFTENSLARIRGYDAALDQLADGTSIVIGSDPYFTFLQSFFPGTGQATTYPQTVGQTLLYNGDGITGGLHPNAGGHTYLGNVVWYPALKAALLGQFTPPYTRLRRAAGSKAGSRTSN